MQTKNFSHTPVLLEEVLRELKIKPDGIYVDATVGGAGHSLEIAKKLKTGKLFAFDKDPDAVLVAKEKLKDYTAKIINEDFKDMATILKEEKIEKVDGILMDLGVSSFQLDSKERGFSYLKTGPLDMRMSKKGTSAKDILNTATQEELIYILKEFGEEKFAFKIAQNIILEREKKTIKTTKDFADIINRSVPFKFKRNKNPAKKSFQAIRIAVNGEFFSLKQGLNEAFSILNPGARLLIISFHSLEDRIVKNFYKEKAKGCICPKDIPICVCNKKPQAKIITKKPIIPSKEEISKNKRAHSAKLRVLEKI